MIQYSYLYFRGKSFPFNINIKLDCFTDINIFEAFIPGRRNEFAVLTFPEHEKELWTDEELHNFRVEPDSVDVVYYTLGKRGTCDLCLLLQMQYKSKPLYAEILYFDNAANANVERAAHQSSIALTYSVQDFIDSVVACYEQREVYTPTCSVQSYINTLSSNEHREAYYYDWGEEWKVEDRDFIFENMLVYHAINNDNTKLRRSWSDNCSALNCLCHQSSQLGLLCRGILSGRREALWGDSQRAVLPVLIDRQLNILNLKERQVFLTDMRKNASITIYSPSEHIATSMIFKIFVNIIPYYGIQYYTDCNILLNFDNEDDDDLCWSFIENNNMVWKYIAEKYSKSYKPSKKKHLENYHQKLLQIKRKFEMGIYPNVSFPSVEIINSE